MRLQLGLSSLNRHDSPSGSIRFLFARGFGHARLRHFFHDARACRFAKFFGSAPPAALESKVEIMAKSHMEMLFSHGRGFNRTLRIFLCRVRTCGESILEFPNQEASDPDCDLDYVPNAARKAAQMDGQ
jgi:hypothetical protein